MIAQQSTAAVTVTSMMDRGEGNTVYTCLHAYDFERTNVRGNQGTEIERSQPERLRCSGAMHHSLTPCPCPGPLPLPLGPYAPWPRHLCPWPHSGLKINIKQCPNDQAMPAIVKHCPECEALPQIVEYRTDLSSIAPNCRALP